MKKYLMMAVAGLAIASCNKMDVSGPQLASDAETFSNAEKALGVTIDPNQSWNRCMIRFVCQEASTAGATPI